MATNYIAPPRKEKGATYTTPQVPEDETDVWVISYHLDQCKGAARFKGTTEAVEHCKELPIGWKHVIVEGWFVGQWSYWGEGFPDVVDGEIVSRE